MPSLPSLSEPPLQLVRGLDAAKGLAEAASTFRAALIEAIPRGIRNGILRRIAPEEAELESQQARVLAIQETIRR